MKLIKPNIDLSKYIVLLEPFFAFKSKDNIAKDKLYCEIKSVFETILIEETTKYGLELEGEKLTHSELIAMLAKLTVFTEVNEALSEITSRLQKKLNEERFIEGNNQQKINQAKKGGIGKSAKNQPLKELAATLVNARKFTSRRNAAKTITPEILAKSLELGIALSKDQAEQTITGWLKEMGLPANV